jgi:hypothetical protein
MQVAAAVSGSKLRRRRNAVSAYTYTWQLPCSRLVAVWCVSAAGAGRLSACGSAAAHPTNAPGRSPAAAPSRTPPSSRCRAGAERGLCAASTRSCTSATHRQQAAVKKGRVFCLCQLLGPWAAAAGGQYAAIYAALAAAVVTRTQRSRMVHTPRRIMVLGRRPRPCGITPLPYAPAASSPCTRLCLASPRGSGCRARASFRGTEAGTAVGETPPTTTSCCRTARIPRRRRPPGRPSGGCVLPSCRAAPVVWRQRALSVDGSA